MQTARCTFQDEVCRGVHVTLLILYCIVYLLALSLSVYCVVISCVRRNIFVTFIGQLRE